jgi:chromosome segregation ATPase
MKSLLLAARHPLFLAVLFIAVVAAFFAWWLLPLGVIIYLTAVVLASRDAALLDSAERSTRRAGIESMTFIDRLNAIERARDNALHSLQKTGGPVAGRLLPSVQAQTDELIEQAYTLARKGQDIEQYLEQINPRRIQDEIDTIDKRIAQASDTYIRDQLESTRQVLVQQKQNGEVLRTYVGRVLSQLENIDANLSAMPAQFLRMRASDAEASIARSQVEDSLNSLNADMHAFVNVLDNALDQTHAAPPA